MHAARNTGRSHTVGLRKDGTVLVTGWNNEGQCDVHDWSDVVSIAAGWRRTLAVLADGSARATDRRNEETTTSRTGANWWPSQRETGTPSVSGRTARSWLLVAPAGGQCEIAGWRDVRVVAVGDRSVGVLDAPAWRDVTALSAGSRHTVAVVAGGRVLAAGDDSYGQCEVGQWRDVVAVAAGSAHTLGLCSDGTVLAAGSDDDGQCATTGWQLAPAQ